MTSNSLPSLGTLPVELLHGIFYHLDAETIVCSVRLVCRYFRSVVQSYHFYRCALDLNLMSKSNFYCLCRLINPEDVISLTLSNDERTPDQIALFISLVDLSRFTRLHSLTLFNIDECQLTVILTEINLNLLTSFSFNIRTYNKQYTEITIILLESVIGQSSLQTLELNFKVERMWTIKWPINCTIQYLTINGSITMTYIECFRQLRSFTYIGNLWATIDELELFLVLAPSLNYLKVICMTDMEMLDGNEWKEFVEMNLTQLNTFEFYFSVSQFDQHHERDPELIISSFRTPFWIEQKKWFVTCEYDLSLKAEIHLYSIPICKSHISYISKSTKMMVSTYPVTLSNDKLLTNNINSLALILNQSAADDIRESNIATNHPLFPQVTDIHITFDNIWPLVSLETLFALIDVSRITAMKISNGLSYRYDHDTLIDLFAFLEQLPNLSILTIEKNLRKCAAVAPLENIHPFLPRHVKHLRIQINCLEQIETIFKRCQNLLTITFDNLILELRNKIKTWFDDNSVNTTYEQTTNGTVFVWLGKMKLQSTETYVQHQPIQTQD